MLAMLLLGAVALADGVTVAAHAQGGAGNAARQAGASAAVGVPLGERLTLEAVGEGARASAGTSTIRARGELRWALTPAAWRPSVLVGGGIEAGGGLAPQLAAGVAMDGPQRGRVAPRLQARYLLGADLTPQAMVVDVGVVWGGRSTTPAPEPVAVVAPHPDHETDITALVTDPDELLVWVPHPFCEWRPASEAEALLASLPSEQQVHVSADGFLPQVVDLTGSESVTLRPAPAQGAVVVSAGLGDRVEIVTAETTQPLALNAQGGGVATLPEGDVAIHIEGWGRREVHEIATFDGYAMWIQAQPAESERVLFAVGSSDLSAAGKARIGELSALAGGWSYTLRGSASPDGSPQRNAELADARAEAVRAALVAAGLPPERLVLLPTDLTGAGAVEDARSVIVTPTLPSEP